MKKLIYLSLIAVSMLTFNTVTFAQQQQNSLAKGKEIQELYKHLAKGIKYPQKAQQANVHGNNIILFSVVDGKLKDLIVATELGYDCDTEVLNNILSFSKFENIKAGKYALKTSFTLDGSHSAVINAKDKAAAGYAELNMVITAMAPEKNLKTGKITFKTTDPLIILNGKTYTAELSTIKPETIESLEILKDFTAISLYGDEGKNGAMIITTKKNKIVPINPKEGIVVLNGEIKENVFNTLDTETVENITILNGISATALYGDEAKNGALIITTKVANSKKEPAHKQKK